MPLPQQFNPYIPQEELTKALAQYKQTPHQFSDEDVKALKDHAGYYNVPFAEDEERNQSRIGGLLSQIGKGFTEGFTTFDVFKGKPRDEYEAIARNIGHLAGFVGFIPSAPFKLLGLKPLAEAAKYLKGRSAPMVAAKWTTEKASKIVGPALKGAATARAGATGAAAEFLTKPLVKDIAEGAFHLGVASGVSSWQGGVDEMMKGFIGGAQTGAVFRGIGNTIKTDSDTANKVLRGLSASMYQGMHATMAGATTPEQIYEYLLGAYFGWKEMPYHQRAAGKHLGKMVKARQTDPELVKGWEDLDQKTQNFAKEQATQTYGTSEENLAIGYKVAKEMGIDVEKQQEYAENYAKGVTDRVRMVQGAASPESASPLAAEVNKERRREVEDNASNTTEQDNLDVGSELVEVPNFTYQTENFVRRSLRDVWEPEEIKNQSRKIAEISGDIEEQWKDMLNQAFLTNRNPSEDMVNYINSKYGRTLNADEAAFWRSLGNRKLKTKKVPLLTWDNGSIKRVEDVQEGTVPTNLAGNKKLLYEEPKLIDRVYQELTQDPQAQAYSVLDHAVFKTNQGQKEYTLNDVKKHFVREMKKDPQMRELAESGSWEDRAIFWQKVDAAESRFHAENMLSMDARGEYYFSGKGDAARQYYVKYHPNSGNSKEAVSKNLKVLKSIFEDHHVEWDVNFEQSRREFVQEFGGHDLKALGGKFGEMYDKAFVSNIMYEASMNGFQINRAGLKKVLDVGFINDAKNFNKRAQIWFTTGISSNPEYIRGYLAKSKMPLDAEANYNIKLVEDFDEVLYSDGAIVGHPDVIDAMNVDYGLPTAGGSVKSFIVSPNSKYGAMLGKYMIHSAPDNLRLWMEKNNVHMIVPRSAAKQIGLRGQLRTDSKGEHYRTLGKMAWKNGGITMDGTPTEKQSYKVHSYDFKGVFSEKNDSHTMDDVSLPKQMQSNLTPYTYSSMLVPKGPERDRIVAQNREAIDDMYENLSSRSFEGDVELNRKADLLAANPEKNSYLLMELEQNFEKIGVPTIIKAMKEPGNEQFANMAYNKMQRSNDEFVRSLVEEGEMTYDEADLFRSEVAEQLKVHEKLMQHSPDSLAGIFHKFGRDYRMNSTRNYVVKRLTRPKVGNSFSSRMRPYDVSLQNRGVAEGPTKILRTKEGENFFFLDESFKDYEIYSTVWNGKAKLGDVWDTYLKGGYGVNQAKVKEVLRTALTRVPMDSMSGSHILNFGGFTGVRGYGVLLHPKTMDALGGADLDGDKAFGFFGSERYGFKKSWKDLYHAQKNEGEGIRSDELKNKYRDNFVTGMDATVQEFTDPFYQYSPHTRKRISEAAYTGRMSLGPTVVNRATLNAAWSAVRGTKDGFFDYDTTMQGLTTTDKKTGKQEYQAEGKIKVRMTPLIDSDNMKLFREKARAAISFASDPMDEGGLKNRATFFDELSQHLFKWEVYDPRTGEIIKDLTQSYNDPKSGNFNRNRRAGIVKIMSDINSKLYGKNVIEGRRWSFFEVQDALEGGNAVHPNGRNNMLSKLAESLHGVDYSDGVFNRVNFKALSEMYETHEKGLDKFRWLRNLLGRKHMYVPMGKFTDLINEFSLHTTEGMYNATNKRHANWDRTHKLLTEKYTSGSRKGQYKWGIMNRNRYMERNIENPEYKRYVLNYIKKQAEDFVVNDVSDIASMNLLRKYGDSIGESPVLEHIVAEVEDIKRRSYLMARKKSNMRDIEDLSLNPEEKRLLREIRGELLLDEVPAEQLNSQAEIDQRISTFKNQKNLTPQEREFMDALLLSSINRGYHDLIAKAESITAGKQMSKLFQQQYDSMVKNKDNTTVARIGFASSAVDPRVLADYMQEYKALWNKASSITPKEKARVMGEVEVAGGDRIILDERGNKVEGSTLETPEQDKLTQQYLDEAKPFEGLHDGTLKGEAQNIYYNIKGHLEHYNNKIGKDLNGVVRDVVGKDLNSMNLEDWRNIDRYFEQIKTGTWYQRMFDKVKQKSPEIKKRYYHMFPEAINRDMMRYELELMEVRRPYIDKEGNEKIGPALKPTGVVDMLQRYVYSAQENAINIGQEKKKELKESLRPYVDSIPEGRALYRMAVRIREAKHLGNQQFDYKKYLREESERLNWNELKDKEFGILVGDKRIMMSGRQVVENINDIINKQNKAVYKWLAGDKEKVDRYLNIDDGTHEGLVRMKNTFLEDLKTAARENRPMDIELGIDGLNRIAKRILISQVPAEGRAEAQAALRKNLEIDTTNDLGSEGYFPHVNFDRGSARKRLLESIERTLDEKGVDPAERDKKVQGLIHHYKQMTGDWVTKDEMGDRWDEIGDHLAGIATKKGASKNYIQWYKSKMRVGNQYKRSSEPIPGWDVDPEAYDFYMKNVVDTFYRITSQIASRSLINDWSADFYHRAGKDKALTNSWRQFLRLYVQDSMGYPSQIPESVLNDPKMKLKGTPYAWMADSNVLDRVNKIASKLGIRQRKDLPGELKGFGYKDLSAWTNLEAKYQLATLLAHPKSSIANLYGGTSMTVISTGWENFRNARKIDYLKNTVNSKWTRMQDVEDWVTSHGVIEEFLRYEADINPQVKGEKWGRFFDDAMAKIKKDPNMNDATLRELSRKHGLTDKMFEAAASFMRVPERILRRDSFMAHYLQAKEKFGGAITDFNDPFLIEMAKKGVKSTQFLYSAPFRPAFARTALGKVMTRFQLWAWNSVRFRNQVLREAEVRGWREGTPEFKKFQRLATHDLFVYGMAGIFMYSLFENALPAPWNWFQDTADLLFGDDKERERAFFGAYPYPLQPLQLITPPAARLLPPMFKGMVTGDYEKLANYYVWTMFPFGRLAKDVVGPGGVLENPVYGVSKLTGIPYVQFVKQVKQGLKEDEELEGA